MGILLENMKNIQLYYFRVSFELKWRLTFEGNQTYLWLTTSAYLFGLWFITIFVIASNY